MTVHRCDTQHSTKQFLCSRQSPALRCCLLETKDKQHVMINTTGMMRLHIFNAHSVDDWSCLKTAADLEQLATGR